MCVTYKEVIHAELVPCFSIQMPSMKIDFDINDAFSINVAHCGLGARCFTGLILIFYKGTEYFPKGK